MSRRNIVWMEQGRFRAAALPDSGAAVIGRTSGVDVVIADDTVSRKHASITSDGAEAAIENLSTTNTTLVNGAPVKARTVLHDGDLIRLGNASATFHDLASADKIADLACSHCARPNPTGRTECWFCGTSLVNAPTVRVARMLARCRIVAADGARFDLFDGDALLLPAGGKPQPSPGEAMKDHDDLAIAARDAGIHLVPGAKGGAARVNAVDTTAATQLSSGDEFDTGDHQLLILAR